MRTLCIALIAALLLAGSSADAQSSWYSSYYRVSLTSGLTGTSAQTAIRSALNRLYGTSSSDTTSFSYSGSFTTFRVYGGSYWDTQENAAKWGMGNATTNSTLRGLLGFSTCIVTSAPSSTPSPSSSTSSWYSPYYKVSLTSGLTGSSAKFAIQSALTREYGISSSDTSSFYYEGSFTTFRIYGGSSWDSQETAAKNGLFNAQTNSTLRARLGFASCTQTIAPNINAAVAAAFGTLFIVLILIGVALVICVVAIIVCCCCCTAKAVADASAPPQQTVVMANQAAYVPMQPGMQQGYAQPGQVQGGAML